MREHYSFSEDPATHENTIKLREELLKIIKIYIKSNKNVFYFIYFILFFAKILILCNRSLMQTSKQSQDISKIARKL